MTSTVPRFESATLPGGVGFRSHRTSKRKTILVKVYLVADLDDTACPRALVPLVLRRGTRALPDMQLLHRYQGELWGATLRHATSKFGEWHLTRFELEVVSDVYLPGERDLLGRGIRLLGDLLYDPYVVDGAFSPEYVDQEKASQRHSIESLIDDKPAWANFRLVETMCEREPYRLSELGTVEDLGGIDARGLWERYRDWFRTAPMTAYIIGDTDMDQARDLLAQVLEGRREESTRTIRGVPPSVPVGEPRTVKEELDIQQARLVMGYRHGITLASEEYPALVVMNAILGPYSRSKLFQNVREKASLAYTTTSWTDATKGLLFIHSGIASDKLDAVVDITEKQIRAMRTGDFSDDDLEAMRRTLVSHNTIVEDNFSVLAGYDFAYALHGAEHDLEQFRTRLAAVTRDEVVAVANRLELDTTYFLHG